MGLLIFVGGGMVGIMSDFELLSLVLMILAILHRSKEITAVSLTKIGGYF